VPVPPLPCSKKELARIGDRMADGTATEDDRVVFAAALDAYDQRRSAVQAGFEALDWSGLYKRPMDLAISGRTKSIDTLLDKLRRSPTLKLPTIQDIAGIRIVGPFTLAEQDVLATGLAKAFAEMSADEAGQAPRIVDRRSTPAAGYRAVHVVGRASGLLLEIQIRTELQATWADTYEKFADIFGRPLRYLSTDDLARFASATDDPSVEAQLRAAVAHYALVLQDVSITEIAEVEKLLPVFALGEAAMDTTVTLEGVELTVREVAEISKGLRDRVVAKLQTILDNLEPVQSAAHLLTWG